MARKKAVANQESPGFIGKVGNGFKSLYKDLKNSRYKKGLIQDFDWGFFILIMLLCAFGIVSIFAATATSIEDTNATFLERVSQQSSEYAGYQFLWVLAGIVVIAAICFFDYNIFSKYANAIYWFNIILLIFVLFMEKGRGDMAGWFKWGSDGSRTFQPSEIGKLAIIISLAKLFSQRGKRIDTVKELLPALLYVFVPLLLIILQPDVGTALVYIAIFAVMVFFSGTNWKLLLGTIALLTLLVLPLWYLLNVSEDSFRLERLMVYLDPTYDTNGSGMQVANAKIAVGSGGLWGKGMFSDGCFASLNYIPDDYTDFVFAIVCESFGFVGAAVLILLFLILIIRMIALSYQVDDPFGRYMIIGVVGMMFFHILENAGMVVGLLPVTGIPLPFISYGGSNMVSSMAGMGIVLSVTMRNRSRKRVGRRSAVARL